MTTYVIDPTNPLPPTTRDYEHALQTTEGDTVILREGADIRASGYFADGIHASGWVNLLIDGGVSSAQSFGILMSGTLSIGQSGKVVGEEGVFLEGGFDHLSNFVNNAGTISGEDAGIFVKASQTAIYNSGTITGDHGIWSYPTNSSTASLTITNTGVIEATGGEAIFGSAHGRNTVINSGIIKGSVLLGYGNDLYDGRSGSLTGDIYLYSGDDVAFGGAGSETFRIDGGTHVIDGGEGSDTIQFRRQAFVDLRVTDEQKTSDTSWDTIRNVENLIGSPLADRLYGSDDANILDGAGGNDLLEGNDGDDLLIGGSGSDSISGGSGVDVSKYSGNFADYTIRKQADGSYAILDTRTGLNDGSDVLIGIEYAQFADRTIALTSTSNSAPTSVSLDTTSVDASAKPGALVGHLSGVDPDGDALGYFLASNPGGHFRIQGDQLLVEKAFAHGDTTFDVVVRASDPKGASLDEHFTIKVVNGSVSVVPKGQVSGPAQSADDPSRPEEVAPSLSLGGSKKADRLVGGAGDDRLDGKLGADKLTGGAGDDVFAFTTKLGKGNVDRILDFKAGDDMIQLSGKIFAKIGKGHLDKGEFRLGTKALDEDDRIIYDRKSGNLFYDKDGSGTAYAAVKFAHVKAKADLSVHDFLIV
ncbi:calcium-binding protein [Microvirga sp. 17 mud 1-3]|uniref:calcium-binding protein n=1 Tax=Microvirga sp. 17 mud 1-3 TaxID=2082949 RepID=UPI000D6B1157|nr:calcium-binding protein [Microvirga sp. 17 mud 1-3]AWM85980.1 hypothetical protein C4E04_03955 [Microvirga sp. 17 mud 1-3]